MRQRAGHARPRPPRVLAAAVLALALAAVTACTGESEPEPPAIPTQAPAPLTVGVYGSGGEIEAFQAVVDAFDEQSTAVGVEMRSWRDHDSAMEALLSSGEVPDVFLASWRDLARLQRNELIQPVGDLLDERGVQFGDDYSREAVLAFARDDALQCMPFGISPMVIYYNTDLVDFERMRLRGLEVPEPDAQRWSFEEFAAAAEFATRPRRGTRGVHIEPTLAGLAPFIYSGGGRVFDDEQEPTSLAFSSDETRAALETTLQLLRNPIVTLTPEQLAEAPAIEWFTQGRLGMMAGFRGVVPELRAAEDLDFDVMPMPVLDDAATVAEITAFCLAADTEAVDAAADLLAHLTSTGSVTQVAQAGYVVPASLEAAESNAFLRPDLRPGAARVYNASVRALVQPPPLEDYASLEEAVAPGLRRLMNTAVLDLEAVTEEIDAASRTVLTPATESPAPEEP